MATITGQEAIIRDGKIIGAPMVSAQADKVLVTDRNGAIVGSEVSKNTLEELNMLITDTTGQDIADALSALINAVKPDASDIAYDNNTTVKGKIDEINEKFIWEEKQFSILYASSTNPVSFTYYDISKSGYTPIGVIGWNISGSSATYAFVNACTISSDGRLYFSVRMRDNGTYTHTLIAKILYVKN